MVDDLVVVITGAAGRIGSAIAEGVLSNGGKVILIDVNKANLDKLEEHLGSEKALTMLLTQASQTKRTVAYVKASSDSTHRCSSSCSISSIRGLGMRFENIQRDHLNEDLCTQLGGAILSQRMLKLFSRQGRGNLIHISSIMGVVTPKFENYVSTEMTSPAEYTAIKAALIATTKYLAEYYKGKNIRVNCISPGGILAQQPESFIDNYRSCCNEKGMLDPEDIVGTALYLLSDQSRYVTGQNIIVDDGWSL